MKTEKEIKEVADLFALSLKRPTTKELQVRIVTTLMVLKWVLEGDTTMESIISMLMIQNSLEEI